MVLIETDYTDFKQYLGTLARSSRKNWKACQKMNNGVTYEEIPFDFTLVEQFMGIGGKQLVRGQPIEWAFGAGWVDHLAKKGDIKLFVAKKDIPLAVHFIQRRNGYWECHPPMYDKITYERKMLGKFMWFNLIKWAIENKEMPLNLGGGPDDWQIHLQNRERYPNPRYKFAYVPESIKEHPLSAKPYYIKECQLLLRDL